MHLIMVGILVPSSSLFACLEYQTTFSLPVKSKYRYVGQEIIRLWMMKAGKTSHAKFPRFITMDLFFNRAFLRP